MLVTVVEEGSPAGLAGIEQDDILFEINGKKVRDIEDFNKNMALAREDFEPNNNIAEIKLWKPSVIKDTIYGKRVKVKVLGVDFS